MKFRSCSFGNSVQFKFDDYSINPLEALDYFKSVHLVVCSRSADYNK